MSALSPRHLVDVYECGHRVGLKKAVAAGIEIPQSPADALVTELGDAHEKAVLAVLEGALGELSQPSHQVRGVDPALTNSYQSALASPEGELHGIPDFLLDARGLAALGVEGGGVVLEPVDAKLSRTTKDRALLQMAVYGEILARMGYPRPRRGHLVLASTTKPYEVESHILTPLYPLVEVLLKAYGEIPALAGSERPWGEKSSACTLCPFSGHCEEERTKAGDLTLLAGIVPSQREALAGVGVYTVSELASLEERPGRMGEDTFKRLRAQATLRSKELSGEGPQILWGSPESGFPSGPTGLQLPPERGESGLRPRGSEGFLPQPHEEDLFFDFEGFPHAPGGGLEYLFGWVKKEGEDVVFSHLWADSEEEEKAALEEFVDFLSAHFAEHPEAHLYHYATYEKTMLRRMAKKYSTREEEVEALIQADRLVDLLPIVKHSLLVGAGSYSIKKLEKLYLPVQRSGSVVSAGESVVEYDRYKKALVRNPAEAAEVKASILSYNEDDCVSTRELLLWLDSHRAEALSGFSLVGEVAESREASESTQEQRGEIRRLEEVLRLAREGESSEDATWREALQALVGYYEREKGLYWGEVLRKYDLTDADLVGDDDVVRVLGVGRVLENPSPRAKNSFVELLLPEATRLTDGMLHNGASLKGVKAPQQEALTAAAEAAGVEWESPTSLWVSGDPGALREMLAERTLLHRSYVPAQKKQDVLLRTAELVAQGEEVPGSARAVVLRSGMELVESAQESEDVLEESLSALSVLAEGSYLAVQGPPGAGKTYLAVKAIEEARERGWSVGVATVARKAYENVLEGVREIGMPTLAHASGVKTLAKGSLDVRLWAGGEAKDTHVLGGTMFGFANLALGVLEGEKPIDLLVIDEASQVPLVDLLAVAPGAKRLLLLGDPCQLPHVSQAAHPEGWDVSVLGHLVGEETVMPAEHGFFLDQTRRFPEGLAELVSEIAYEGRLSAHPSTAAYHVDSRKGAFVLPVVHTGCSTASFEEARAVAALVKDLLDKEVCTKKGVRALEEGDVIVVAPYNAQVRCIEKVLSEKGLPGVRVGTVDRFQGQEAAVSVYSLTVSSAHDAPRGLEFILDKARMNVALSRAQAVAVVVGSPALTREYTTGLERMYALARACRVFSLPRW